jgi:hypothetical protein
MEQTMTEALDKILAENDRFDRVYKLARSWGATEELADAFASSQKNKFQWDGVQLTIDGKVAVDDPDVKARFTTGPLAPLFPKAAADAGPDLDPALVASALAGNRTAYSRLFVACGRDKAVLDAALTAKKGDKPDADSGADTLPDKAQKYAGANNPWSAAGWSITRQGQLVKQLGLAAATSIAASASSFIGATKPSRAA